MEEGLNALEIKVLEKMLSAEQSDRATEIGRQLKVCSVSRREYTGTGFFTYFDIPQNVDPIVPENFEFGSLNAHLEGLRNGAGFVLFVRNGRLSFLEGFTYTEPWPEKTVFVRWFEGSDIQNVEEGAPSDNR
jgi:hypothetical protein